MQVIGRDGEGKEKRILYRKKKKQHTTLFNKRPMGPVSLTCFHLQNCFKVFAIPETLF